MDYITERKLLNHIKEEYSTSEFWSPITDVLHTDYSCPNQFFTFYRTIDFEGKRYYCQMVREVIFEPDDLKKVKHIFPFFTRLDEMPDHLISGGEENTEYFDGSEEEANDFNEIEALKLKIASLRNENMELRDRLEKYDKTYGEKPEN